MEKIIASAPNCVYIAGEAGFEWGGKALVAPVEFEGKRNLAQFSFQEREGMITAYRGSRMATMNRSGRISGDDEMRLTLEAVKAAFSSLGASLDETEASFSISLDCASAPDSAGMAASVCAAAYAGVYHYLGKKGAARDAFLAGYKQFEYFGVDEVSAKAVASDNAQVLRRDFLLDGTTKLLAKPVDLVLPNDTGLVYAWPKDAVRKPRVREMADALAKSRGVVKASGAIKAAREMTSGEREKASEGFALVVDKVCKELSEGGSPEKLASFLELDQAMLADAGLSTKKSDEMIAVAKGAGAMAAKISGYSDDVLVYCWQKDAGAIIEALTAKEYFAYPLEAALGGVSSEGAVAPAKPPA